MYKFGTFALTALLLSCIPQAFAQNPSPAYICQFWHAVEGIDPHTGKPTKIFTPAGRYEDPFSFAECAGTCTRDNQSCNERSYLFFKSCTCNEIAPPEPTGAQINVEDVVETTRQALIRLIEERDGVHRLGLDEVQAEEEEKILGQLIRQTKQLVATLETGATLVSEEDKQLLNFLLQTQSEDRACGQEK